MIEGGAGAAGAVKSAASGGNITTFAMFGLSAIGLVFITLTVAAYAKTIFLKLEV